MRSAATVRRSSAVGIDRGPARGGHAGHSPRSLGRGPLPRDLGFEIPVRCSSTTSGISRTPPTNFRSQASSWWVVRTDTKAVNPRLTLPGSALRVRRANDRFRPGVPHVGASAKIRWKRFRERVADLPRTLALPFVEPEEADRIRGEMRAEAFSRIAREQRWGTVLSGVGSTLDATAGARRILAQVIRDYRITSLLDVPCGDFGWMPLVLNDAAPGLRYIGGDIVPALVERNSEAHPRHDFRVIDFARDPLPVADLIVCRDALQHLPVATIQQALQNFSRSGCGYLLATTHLRRTGYRNWQPCRPGSCRDRNLMLPPFGLPDPLVIFSEKTERKFLGLWQLPFA